MKICPKCKDKFPLWVNFCERDGEALEEYDEKSSCEQPEDLSLSDETVEEKIQLPTQIILVVKEDNTFVRPPQDEPVVSECLDGGEHKPDGTGWCELCGEKIESFENNYVESVIDHSFAGICTRGVTKERNQDWFEIRKIKSGDDTTFIVAVADGVSRSSLLADGAAQVASREVCGFVEEALSKPGILSYLKIIDDAILHAHSKVVEYGKSNGCGSKNAPETTIALMIVHKGRAFYGWVGDCRIYWITASGAGLLTYDHSYVNDAVDNGIPLTIVEKSRYAHAITRALGALDEKPEPSLNTFPLPDDVLLISSSDGLWNYMPEADDLAQVVRSVPDYVNSIGLSRHLVSEAMTKTAPDGRRPGDDNITVAALSLNSCNSN